MHVDNSPYAPSKNFFYSRPEEKTPKNSPCAKMKNVTSSWRETIIPRKLTFSPQTNSITRIELADLPTKKEEELQRCLEKPFFFHPAYLEQVGKFFQELFTEEYKEGQMDDELAAILSTTFLEGEGGPPSKPVDVPIALLNFKEYVDNSHLPEAQAFSALLSTTIEFTLLNRLILSFMPPAHEETLQEMYEKLLAEKIDGLKVGEELLLPGGWISMPETGIETGHFIPIYIKRESAGLYVHLMNAQPDRSTIGILTVNYLSLVPTTEASQIAKGIADFVFPRTLGQVFPAELQQKYRAAFRSLQTDPPEILHPRISRPAQNKASNCATIPLFATYELFLKLRGGYTNEAKKSFVEGYRSFIQAKIKAAK